MDCVLSSISVLMICNKNTCCAFWMSVRMTQTHCQGQLRCFGCPGRFKPPDKYPCCWRVLEQDTPPVCRVAVAELTICDVEVGGGACEQRISLCITLTCPCLRYSWFFSHYNTPCHPRHTHTHTPSHILLLTKCTGSRSSIFTSHILFCRPCECDPSGSVDHCSPLDGRCHCKPNVEGQACDRCVISLLLASWMCVYDPWLPRQLHNEGWAEDDTSVSHVCFVSAESNVLITSVGLIALIFTPRSDIHVWFV